MKLFDDTYIVFNQMKISFKNLLVLDRSITSGLADDKYGYKITSTVASKIQNIVFENMSLIDVTRIKDVICIQTLRKIYEIKH